MLLALLGGAACRTDTLPPSIWPPADFALTVEELALDRGEVRAVRRFRATADGLVVYGVASRNVVNPETGAALPVFDRLSIYRLVPTCVRALARGVEQAGVTKLDKAQGERGADGDSGGLVLTWQAFGRLDKITARGRVHGPMARILGLVAAHLPDGERFGLPELADLAVVAKLRGVPPPRTDARGALLALREQLDGHPDDRATVLDAFALACAVGDRRIAQQLLATWQDLAPPASSSFPDEVATLTAEVLQRMLPQ